MYKYNKCAYNKRIKKETMVHPLHLQKIHISVLVH